MKRKVDMMNEKPQITALPAMRFGSRKKVPTSVLNEFVREYAGRDIVAEVDRIELEKMRKKKKLQHSKETREFARGLAEHAERCIVDVYRETGRGASLDAKEMAQAIVAIKTLAHDDATGDEPARRKPTELTHFIRGLDIDDDEDEGRLF